MVEVFRTNVKDRVHASMLLDLIHVAFRDHNANFDLEDCDRILRIKCSTGFVQSSLLIKLLNGLGFHAEVLPDDQPLILRKTKIFIADNMNN